VIETLQLVCPRDRSPLEPRDGELVCPHGHSYPLVESIAVVVDPELEPTQPGYWASPEQIEQARAEQPPLVDGSSVDPYVETLIVGTHGNLYRGVRGLSRYPIPRFPFPRAAPGRLLDVGCNWGRWTIAARRAGYEPVGIDPSIQAIVAAARIARQLDEDVAYVVGDARSLPFPDESFDVVFSYSVLQHFDDAAFGRAAEEMSRVLITGGVAYIQVANRYGLRNLAKLARRGFAPGSRFDVRYRTPMQLRRTFSCIGDVSLAPQGFFTLNAQPDDLDLLSRPARAVVRTSEALRRASGLVSSNVLADSVWVCATKS
jgi:SAM-dependent methyltransferase